MSVRNLSKWWILGVAALATACVIEEAGSDPTTPGSGGSQGSGGDGAGGDGAGGDGGAGAGSGGGGADGSGGDGSGGDGAGGGDATTPDPYIEDCDDDEALHGMADREDAVPLGRAEVCTASGTEHWFSVATPDTGGAHVLKLDIEQTPNARIRVRAFSGADNSQLGTYLATAGVSRTLHITVGSDALTYIQVEQYAGEGRVDLELTQTPEADEHEPNNVRGDAAPIPLDEDITAQIMIPYVADEDQSPNDWYSVELEGGAETTIGLTQVPSNVRFRIAVVNDAGVNQSNSIAPNNGALHELTFTPSTSGTYYIELSPYAAADFGPFISSGVPSHLTDSYTLRVEQE